MGCLFFNGGVLERTILNS